VGIAGNQTGVYHSPRPVLEIAWTHSNGDVFRTTGTSEPLSMETACVLPDFRGAICGFGEGMGVIQVQEPGLFTTVQDLWGEKVSAPWVFQLPGRRMRFRSGWETDWLAMLRGQPGWK